MVSKGFILPLVHWRSITSAVTMPSLRSVRRLFPRDNAVMVTLPYVNFLGVSGSFGTDRKSLPLCFQLAAFARQDGFDVSEVQDLQLTPIRIAWFTKDDSKKAMGNLCYGDYRHKTEIVVYIMPVFYRVLSYSTKILDSITFNFTRTGCRKLEIFKPDGV